MMITWNPRDYAANSSQQHKWARELIAKLQLRGDERVLDIGCGDGKVAAEIARQLPGGAVVGLDCSADMIAYAKDTFRQEVNLGFTLGDASTLPFNREFDVVFSNACLHWIYDHRPVLAGMRNALRANGRVLLQMGGAGNAAAILGVVNLMMREEPWRRYFEGTAFRFGFHGPDEYRTWLAEAGFRPIRVELIPKLMLHAGAAGLTGWFRTTWMPYIQPVPQEHRDRYITEVVNRYLERHPLNDERMTVVQMVRLEVEAECA